MIIIIMMMIMIMIMIITIMIMIIIGTSIALIPYSPLALNMILYIIMDYIYATQLTPSNPSVVDYMKHLNNLLS